MDSKKKHTKRKCIIIKQGGLYCFNNFYKKYLNRDHMTSLDILLYKDMHFEINNKNVSYKLKDGYYMEIEFGFPAGKFPDRCYQCKSIVMGIDDYFLMLDSKPIICLFKSKSKQTTCDKKEFYRILHNEKIYWITELKLTHYFKLAL